MQQNHKYHQTFLFQRSQLRLYLHTHTHMQKKKKKKKLQIKFSSVRLKVKLTEKGDVRQCECVVLMSKLKLEFDSEFKEQENQPHN